MASPHEDDEPGSSTGPLYRVDSLQEENERLRKDLEDCRDQLFQIMRKGNDTPESDIKTAFDMIYSGISSWIDEVSCEENVEESFRAQFTQNLQHKSIFAALGLHSHCCSDIAWLVKLGNSKYSLRIVFSLAISQFLTNEIFRQEKTYSHWGNLYPHGITETKIECIVNVQRKMKDELQRDESEVSKWRGQTISAMLAFDDAKTLARETSMKHLSTLKRYLEDWLGKNLSKPLSDSLMESVILRATKALDMVCCSNKTYLLGSLSIAPGPMDEEAEEMLKMVPIKDMISWQLTKPPRKIVDLLQCLYPAVMRMGESGQDDLILVQPTWLGYEQSGHLPQVSRPPPVTRPHYERKISKRQAEPPRTNPTKKPPQPFKSLSAIIFGNRPSGTNARTGRVSPKISSQPSTSRGSSSQQDPSGHHYSQEPLNAEMYSSNDTWKIEYAPPYEISSNTTSGYSRVSDSEHPRRASTTKF